MIGVVRAVRRARRTKPQVVGSLGAADVKHTLSDPWKVFLNPKEIVTHRSLSSDDKQQILQTWQEDATQLSVAEGEGMGGGEPNRLSDVSEAKQKLAESEHRRVPSDKTI
ncbi:MAG TPA: hypothetical protein VL137_13770 [Polyangiaceae bacterium]|nr:hypothetical protein [Polyangiaceae bacterium]